jgi:hypothetical protein
MDAGPAGKCSNLTKEIEYVIRAALANHAITSWIAMPGRYCYGIKGDNKFS